MRIEDDKSFRTLTKFFSKEPVELESQIIDYLDDVLTGDYWGTRLGDIIEKAGKSPLTYCMNLFGKVPSDIVGAFSDLHLYSTVSETATTISIPVGTGGINGTISLNYIPKGGGVRTLVNSIIREDSGTIIITGDLEVTGSVVAYSDSSSTSTIWSGLVSAVQSRVSLGDLMDVTASPLTDGYALTYNATLGSFVLAEVATGGIVSETDPIFTSWRDNRAAYSIPGRASGTVGVLADIVAASNGVLRRSGTGDISFGTLVTGNIGNSQVTLAKMQDLSANRILGALVAGAPTELTGANVRTISGTLESGTGAGQIRTNTQLDSRFVYVSGDTMTGGLTLSGTYGSQIILDRADISGTNVWNIDQSIDGGSGRSIRVRYNSVVVFRVLSTGARVDGSLLVTGDIEANGNITAYTT